MEIIKQSVNTMAIKVGPTNKTAFTTGGMKLQAMQEYEIKTEARSF
jgi:hypothetical protein